MAITVDDFNIRGLGKCSLNGADIFRCISSCLSMRQVIGAFVAQPNTTICPIWQGPFAKSFRVYLADLFSFITSHATLRLTICVRVHLGQVLALVPMHDMTHRPS